MTRLTRRAFATFVTASLTALAACSTDSITNALSDPGQTGSGGATGSSSTMITFWTDDSSPSAIAVSLDGVNVGSLTAYRTSAPTCGATSSTGTLTVPVSAGSHSVSARETTANGVWNASTVTVSSGGCLTYAFRK